MSNGPATAGSALELRTAGLPDLPLIARMNRDLIQDEGARNPMGLAELEARARGFMTGGEWQFEIVERDGRPIGYALWRWRDDVSEEAGRSIFLRQFFLERAERGRGTGQQAFRLLMAERFPAGARVSLEVLHGNETGGAFWRRLGFLPFAHHLDRRADAGPLSPKRDASP